ncbi:MAG: nucleotide exchange factor GrpE [Minisyncoccia bacterium]
MEEDEIVFDEDIVESNEDGTELSGADQLKKLRAQIKVLQKEKTEYLDGWQRARADYANVVKSADEDKKRMRSIVEESFIEELLPVVDSFSLAMNNKDAWEKVDANWRTGVEYIYAQLMNTLKEKGFSVFGAVGDSFDPTLHEAVSETKTDDSALDHSVSAVLQQGYKLGESILRPARVSVYKAK